MPDSRSSAGVLTRLPRWRKPLLISLIWMLPVTLALTFVREWQGVLVALLALGAAVATLLLHGTAGGASGGVDESPRPLPDEPSTADRAHSMDDSMTRSGLFDSRPTSDGEIDISSSGNFSIVDMVDRLEPSQFRWIESSLAEQQFLGWSLVQLQRMSFLDLVHEDDRKPAEDAFRQAVAKGEYLGLVVRIRTSQGRTKAVEVNAGARYGADQKVSYLRCHLTDITDKVRAERELRIRSRELKQLNEQLRQINRELEELKDRYTDLYENAPAMYLSLDAEGRVVDCNHTVLETLDRRREDLIDRSFEEFLHPSELSRDRSLFSELLRSGSIESESRWVRSNGATIEVWFSGKVLPRPRGGAPQVRCVAQDLTARHRLESELRDTNRSLERAIEELSAKNRELDEFVYVVSHDLQEPLRTMTAFSEFLLEDHVDRMGAEGEDHLRRIANAARRMQSMIHGLLRLSRAGKVVDEFGSISLADLAAVVRTDLGELIRDRGAEVVVVDPEATLWGDRRRLQQLLSNLMSNAIKYNRSRRPRVEVGLAAPGDHNCGHTGRGSTLFVRDNGIGIDARNHQKIFQPFRRLHSREEFEGTGVGLALCAKIAQAHGGRICVESTPGEGTTFLVHLPDGSDEAGHAPGDDGAAAPS
jgi:PAS domain S-box-containing protein